MISTFDDGKFGQAMSATDTVTSNFLFSGTPAVGTKQEVYASFAADVPVYTVVGRITASKKLVKSVVGATDGSQNAIGVTTSFLAAQAPNADQPVDIFYNGTFNPDALNWDASYNTDALKKYAFEAANPQIVVKKITG
jgi:hypothetical protein